MKLLLASHNRGKLIELRALLAPLGHEIVGLTDLGIADAPEETGATFADNARLKADYYGTRTGLPTIADDSGLCVDALEGEPGVRSARYAGPTADDAANNTRLLAALRDVDRRTARFMCVMVCRRPDGAVIETRGECTGRILDAPRGAGGFGYDPVFLVPTLEKTFAELSADEKNRLSHRGRAVRALVASLPAFLAGAS